MRLFTLLLALLLAFAAPALAGIAPGPFMLIGGGKDQDDLLRRFLALAGGPDALVLVAPLASNDPPRSGRAYAEHFAALGHRRAEVLLAQGLPDAAALARVRAARGFFFSGGDQSRILSALSGAWLAAVKDAWRAGAVIAGTSAGAMVWGERAILEGDPLATAWHGEDPSHAGIRLGPGLGVLPGLVIDTHFAERGRVPRLAYAVANVPATVGLGIDPQTAVLLSADGRIEVLGRGTVTALTMPPQPEAARAPLSYHDMRLWFLAPGDAARLSSGR